MIAKAVNDDVGVNPSEELARKFAPAVDPQNVPGKASEVPKITMIDRPEEPDHNVQWLFPNADRLHPVSDETVSATPGVHLKPAPSLVPFGFEASQPTTRLSRGAVRLGDFL